MLVSFGLTTNDNLFALVHRKIFSAEQIDLCRSAFIADGQAHEFRPFGDCHNGTDNRTGFAVHYIVDFLHLPEIAVFLRNVLYQILDRLDPDSEKLIDLSLLQIEFFQFHHAASNQIM